eukprot:12379383-Karenia_brevis.AAC.1
MWPNLHCALERAPTRRYEICGRDVWPTWAPLPRQPPIRFPVLPCDASNGLHASLASIQKT